MRVYEGKHSKKVTFILPGEFHASHEDIVISTVLGSCISVAMYDPVKKQGGLNHFMLAKNPGENYAMTLPGRYGMTAMEQLINELMKLGSHRSDLIAHVLGGSSANKFQYSKMQSVAVQNIRFAFKYLENENIQIASIDVGGHGGRKVMFRPSDGHLKVNKVEDSQFANKDLRYYKEKVKKNSVQSGEVRLF